MVKRGSCSCARISGSCPDAGGLTAWGLPEILGVLEQDGCAGRCGRENLDGEDDEEVAQIGAPLVPGQEPREAPRMRG